MTSNRPRPLWTKQEIPNHLLPRGTRVIPRTWKKWKIPATDYPIDLEIEFLLKQEKTKSRYATSARRSRTGGKKQPPSKEPKIRPRKDAEAYGILCPYWFARSAIINAVIVANTEASRSQRWTKTEIKSLQDFLKRLEDRTAALRARNIKFLEPWVKSNTRQDRSNNRSRSSTLIEELRGAIGFFDEALSSLEAKFKARRDEITNNKPDYGKHAFVRELGYAWFRLTGSLPGTAEPFPKFILAAWDSLSDNMPEVIWKSTIRSVVETYRDDWAKGRSVIILPNEEGDDLLKLIEERGIKTSTIYRINLA